MLTVQKYIFLICVISTCFGDSGFEDVYVTSENFHEFYGIIPDHIYKIFRLAEVEPKILQPCASTIWMMGDSAIVTWQGASLASASSIHCVDSVRYHCDGPFWYCKIELYQNGEFIYNILPPIPGTMLPPVDLNSLNNHWYSQRGLRLPRFDVSDRLDRFLSGSGCQIRIISSSRGSELDEYIEMWSDPFVIIDPWLNILAPNSSTVWREDSSDVLIRFEVHGSFGFTNNPEFVVPSIHLIRYGDPIDRIWHYGTFNNGELERIVNVKQAWGNGDGYQICLELNGMKSYSEYFSIFGQTIDITLPPVWSINLDWNYQFEWTPSSGETITIELYETSQDGMALEEVMATDIINEGYFVYEDSPNINWAGKYFRIKLEDSDGNYGWSKCICISSVIPG